MLIDQRQARPTDERFTQRLKDTLAMIDVRVCDHLIVAGTVQPTRFAERGLLEPPRRPGVCVSGRRPPGAPRLSDKAATSSGVIVLADQA